MADGFIHGDFFLCPGKKPCHQLAVEGPEMFAAKVKVAILFSKIDMAAPIPFNHEGQIEVGFVRLPVVGSP
jgi:hypothetical protein